LKQGGNSHKDKPPEWSRKQTLVNAERYISGRIKKEYENENFVEQKRKSRN
jgi:hypothetical protein